jgi:hypothetical protein
MSEVKVKANYPVGGIFNPVTREYGPPLEDNNEIPGLVAHTFLDYLPYKSREEVEALLGSITSKVTGNKD